MAKDLPIDADQAFRLALEQAKLAATNHEVPIGCILVKEGRVVCSSFNKTEEQGHFLAHAEINCLIEASKILKTKYLNGCELYVTLEPCRMCVAAASLSRIDSIYYLCASELFGEDGSGYKYVNLNEISSEMTHEAKSLLQSFFQERRKSR